MSARRPLDLGWTHSAVLSVVAKKKPRQRRASVRVDLETKRRLRHGGRKGAATLDEYLARTCVDPGRAPGPLHTQLPYVAKKRFTLEDKFVDVLRADPVLADQDQIVGLLVGPESRLAELVRAHYGPLRCVSLDAPRALAPPLTVAVVRWDATLCGDRQRLKSLFAFLGGLAYLRRLVLYSPDASVTAAEIGRLDENLDGAARPTRVGSFYILEL